MKALKTGSGSIIRVINSGKHYTSQAQDWKLHISIACQSYSQARKVENHIKSMKTRKYLMDLKRYPEISERLLSKYAD